MILKKYFSFQYRSLSSKFSNYFAIIECEFRIPKIFKKLTNISFVDENFYQLPSNILSFLITNCSGKQILICDRNFCKRSSKNRVHISLLYSTLNSLGKELLHQLLVKIFVNDPQGNKFIYFYMFSHRYLFNLLIPNSRILQETNSYISCR